MNKATLTALSMLALTGSAHAQVAFDQNVTNNVIFGSGNTNGSFTTSRSAGLEIGLRGKLRFNALNQAENTFNSNGDGSYTFQNGAAPSGFGFIGDNSNTPVWSFEWSINTDFDGSAPGRTLNDFTYVLTLDGDASASVTGGAFDPINGSNPGLGRVQWDHSMGDSSTTSATDVSISNGANDAAGYATNIDTYSLAQNSWSYAFFPAAVPGFDVDAVGTYTISLEAFDGTTSMGMSTIDINVVPTPASAAILGLGGLAAVRRRR